MKGHCAGSVESGQLSPTAVYLYGKTHTEKTWLPSPASCAVDALVRYCTLLPAIAVAAATFVVRDAARATLHWRSCLARFLQSHITASDSVAFAAPTSIWARPLPILHQRSCYSCLAYPPPA